MSELLGEIKIFDEIDTVPLKLGGKTSIHMFYGRSIFSLVVIGFNRGNLVKCCGSLRRGMLGQ